MFTSCVVHGWVHTSLCDTVCWCRPVERKQFYSNRVMISQKKKLLLSFFQMYFTGAPDTTSCHIVLLERWQTSLHLLSDVRCSSHTVSRWCKLHMKSWSCESWGACDLLFDSVITEGSRFLPLS